LAREINFEAIGSPTQAKVYGAPSIILSFVPLSGEQLKRVYKKNIGAYVWENRLHT
jgi:hypothetical protein